MFNKVLSFKILISLFFYSMSLNQDQIYLSLLIYDYNVFQFYKLNIEFY